MSSDFEATKANYRWLHEQGLRADQLQAQIDAIREALSYVDRYDDSTCWTAVRDIEKILGLDTRT